MGGTASQLFGIKLGGSWGGRQRWWRVSIILSLVWSYLRVDGIGNNESSLVHHRGFVGKFTFPATPDQEEQEQMLGGGSIVNTISATPYKCTRRYGTGLGGGVSSWCSVGSNTDCSVRSVLSPPITAFIAAVMSFSSHLNDALLHSTAFSDLFLSGARCYPATKLKSTITLVFSLTLHFSFIQQESDRPYISEKDLITLPPSCLPSCISIRARGCNGGSLKWDWLSPAGPDSECVRAIYAGIGS